jgi:uncharacterized membrane protein YqaE (UPF0057 family)
MWNRRRRTIESSVLITHRTWLLVIACILAFIGAWIEKGMGLIVPGFIPSTLHEIVEYSPSWVEHFNWPEHFIFSVR